jgi:hypothetical protein
LNHPVLPRFSARLLSLTTLVFIAASGPSHAHVKWFAPYIVGAPPQPIAGTLTNPCFWTGIALVLVFFLATRALEKSSAGELVLRAMDGITDPLWKRIDEFVRVVIAAFFRGDLRGRRRLPDAGPEDACRMGVMDAASDCGVDFSRKTAARGSWPHRPVGERARALWVAKGKLVFDMEPASHKAADH